jgi:hypothetical protein
MQLIIAEFDDFKVRLDEIFDQFGIRLKCKLLLVNFHDNRRLLLIRFESYSSIEPGQLFQLDQ